MQSTKIKRENAESFSSDAEKNRYERILEVQTRLRNGQSGRYIAKVLHMSTGTVKKYSTGDPAELCKASLWKGYYSPTAQLLEIYRPLIEDELRKGTTINKIATKLIQAGVPAKRGAIRKRIQIWSKEMGIDGRIEFTSNTLGVNIKTKIGCDITEKTISRKDIYVNLWYKTIPEGIKLSDKAKDALNKMGDTFSTLLNCITDFRDLFHYKDSKKLDEFINKYKDSRFDKIASFANGLKNDYEAVKNGVTTSYSSGVVEGHNNRTKAEKRMMYGRCGLSLLLIKRLYQKPSRKSLYRKKRLQSK